MENAQEAKATSSVAIPSMMLRMEELGGWWEEVASGPQWFAVGCDSGICIAGAQYLLHESHIRHHDGLESKTRAALYSCTHSEPDIMSTWNYTLPNP